MTVNNISLFVPPPLATEIGSAYQRLGLGLAQYFPDLIWGYLGSPDLLERVQADPPSLEMLRHHGVAIATAVQKSDLPRNRRERLLRNVRALLWLIRAREGERIIFSEQVRLLLDIRPESGGEEIFQTAHETLAALLPGLGTLAERWADWQSHYTVPAALAMPLLVETVEDLRQQLAALSIPVVEPLRLVEVDSPTPLAYREGQLFVSRQASFRLDRLYHLALQWGYGGCHTVRTATLQRYAEGQGEAECGILLRWGPEQVMEQGLPLALLSKLGLYSATLPALLEKANLPPLLPGQLQAIHIAEDALQWAIANSALLLHREGLRPRAVRRYLAANLLCSTEAADALLEKLVDPVDAAHVFAPLIGGPLLKSWLAQESGSIATLLTDPPVPSTMVFEVEVAG